MRAQWRRFRPEVALSEVEVQAVLDLALPGARVRTATPLPGGLANTNIDVTLDGPPGRVVLRVTQRDQGAAAKEVALAGLLQGRAPAPPVLGFMPEEPTTGLACTVLAWRPGLRLETLVPSPALGMGVGAALAAIHAVGFPSHGFFGADLAVSAPVDMGRDGLLAYLRRQLVEGPGGTRLGAEPTARLLAFAAAEGHALDGWLARPCLVHGDFNGSNILVDAGEVTAVVDWEFAFAGSPAFDFGNLLRAPLDAPGFAASVAEGYVAAGGWLPPGWRRTAEIADLYSWADFLGRPAPSEALLADARAAVAALLG